MGKPGKKRTEKWKKKLKKLKAAYKLAESSTDKKRKTYKAACKACIRKYKKMKKAWKQAAKAAEADRAAYKKALKKWKKINKPKSKPDRPSKGQPSETKLDMPNVAATPSPSPAVAVKERLRKVEGIGPKIEALLHDAGILSFRQLSETKVERLKQILAEAGPRYRMHNPSTWPEQSALAAEDRWEALRALQIELKGGRKV